MSKALSKRSQAQQRNVSTKAQSQLQLAKTDLKISVSDSSIENVWRSAFAQWNSEPALGKKESPKFRESQKAPLHALSQWSSRMTTRSETNKKTVLKERTTVQFPKRAYKRRKSMYTRSDTLRKLDSKKVIKLPEEVRKEPNDNLTPEQKQLANDAAYWEEELGGSAHVEGGQGMFLRVLNLANTKRSTVQGRT
ncbi:uncharacterized protein [Drosophila pseudoobscura]|uniref:Ribosome biogenesis protein SLX9 n=1 Tax=Drosophila pseudoobscura pseudoobscura TaxID=46245 RepID=A0A6I8VNS6_DROPS|nr:uncharacterized protein LOC117183316 [Drosophila pseudoobscura]